MFLIGYDRWLDIRLLAVGLAGVLLAPPFALIISAETDRKIR